MLRQIEVMKQKDQEAADAKRARNAQMIAEVEVSNKVAQERKQEKLRLEREEDLKIVKYNAARIAKEEADAREAARIREEKELEI